MNITRRHLLASISGIVATVHPGLSAWASDPDFDTGQFATARAPNGSFQVVRVQDGVLRKVVALPDRGHGLVRRPNGTDLVVLARRPGDWGLVLDRRSGEPIARLSAPDGHHFYGHATFSADGRYLFTTENAFGTMNVDEETGRLGLWDAAEGYARIGTLRTSGVGPHDVARDRKGRGFWVANGGILTHPDTGRAKLNVADMKPSVCLIDGVSGAVAAEIRLPVSLHQLSLRHIDSSATGQVVFAAQDEGASEVPVPLVGLIDGPDSFRLFDLPEELFGRSQGYCGDVSFNRDGTIVGAGFPRGGFFAFWDVQTGQFLRSVDVSDGCGVSNTHVSPGFVVSSGSGTLGSVEMQDPNGLRWQVLLQSEASFDNHMA